MPAWRVMVTAAFALAWGNAQAAPKQPKPELSTLAERSGYFEARPAMAEFLKRIGRRKLILPVYAALAASPEGKEFARAVFADARPGYHPITAASVEAALK